MTSIRADLARVFPIDLRQCNSIYDLVTQMADSTFSGRMAGEVICTIRQWIIQGHQPTLFHSLADDNPLAAMVYKMEQNGWIEHHRNITKEELATGIYKDQNCIVLGAYPESLESAFLVYSKRCLFINKFGQAPALKIHDGFCPDVAFTDERFFIPLLYDCLGQGSYGGRSNINDFINSIKKFGGLSAEIYDGATTLKAMVEDLRCTVFLTISGALAFSMSLVFCDLIDSRAINYIASTGALMAHGLIASVGLKHYKYNPIHTDARLAAERLNRVFDTLEDEQNFTDIYTIMEKVLAKIVATHRQPGSNQSVVIGSYKLHREIGRYLKNNYPAARGILKSAFEQAVPVVTPAASDSELGNDLFCFNRCHALPGLAAPIIIDSGLDTQKLLAHAIKSDLLGILNIGGGAPGNNTRNLGPLIDVINSRTNPQPPLPAKMFDYGCKIAPDPMWYGHYTGCSFTEASSWLKTRPNGQFAEVHSDATIALPFIVWYALQDSYKKDLEKRQAVMANG